MALFPVAFALVVSIQLLLLFYVDTAKINRAASSSFNTTFVTVLLYIISSASVGTPSFNTTFVTVLLIPVIWMVLRIAVSIQLLLLFYTWNLIQLQSLTTVSIQLLLLFYEDQEALYWWLWWFQYNFCYCSIRCCHRAWKQCKVSIQLLLLFYGKLQFFKDCDHCVSIQVLLLFYAKGVIGSFLVLAFQYNFCYCSIRIFTGFLFYYITRYPLKIKIF